MVNGIFDGGDSSLNSLRVGDSGAIEGNVEIDLETV